MCVCVCVCVCVFCVCVSARAQTTYYLLECYEYTHVDLHVSCKLPVSTCVLSTFYECKLENLALISRQTNGAINAGLFDKFCVRGQCHRSRSLGLTSVPMTDEYIQDTKYNRSLFSQNFLCLRIWKLFVGSGYLGEKKWKYFLCMDGKWYEEIWRFSYFKKVSNVKLVFTSHWVFLISSQEETISKDRSLI